ncbi:signal recognition particle-docking protein FtsY, partial [Treponema pallidum]
QELGIPLAFLGWGERYTDLVEANAREFVSSFLHGER